MDIYNTATLKKAGKNEVEVKIGFECKTCESIKKEGFGPTHNGSRMCKSGSIASGGARAHCTCDTCF